MKTLDAVEPRIPVFTIPGSASWIYVIDQPGSYYFTGNLIGQAGKGGIRVNADNVTIDLNGFSMLGTDPSAGTALFSAADHVTIKNGGIRDWAFGVAFEGNHCRLENLGVSGHDLDGIELLGRGCTIAQCTVADNGGEGIQLAPTAAATAITGCKLFNNNRHQILVEGDGNTIEKCSVVLDEGQGTQPALAVFGSTNIIQMNGVVSGEPGQFAVAVDGHGNELSENMIRLTAGATGAEGIHLGGGEHRLHGGQVMVEAPGATGVQTEPNLVVIAIIAILIGLQPGGDGAIGVQLDGAGASVLNSRIDAIAPNSVAIRDRQAMSYIEQDNLYVGGSGAKGILSEGSASAGVYRNNHIALAGSNQVGIDLAAGEAYTVAGNSIRTTGSGTTCVAVRVPRCSILRNDITLLGTGANGGITVFGGANTFAHIASNSIRSGNASATAISAPEFSNAFILRNTVVGQGTWLGVGEGNQYAQIVANPGLSFVAEDIANLAVGP